MNTITLPAHFDGEQIRLDIPFVLTPNTRLIITVLPQSLSDEEQAAWHTLSAAGLATAYGDDEPEYALNANRWRNWFDFGFSLSAFTKKA